MSPAVTISAETVPRAAEHTESGTGHGELKSGDADRPRGEYEDEIEQNVEQTHHHIEPARHFHVSDAPEHTSTKIIHGEERKGEHKHEEIERSLRAHSLIASEPMRQRSGNTCANESYRYAE